MTLARTLALATVATALLAGCQPATTMMEGIQGREATQAGHTLAVDRFMLSDCRTLSLQEQSLRGAVTNPLRNLAGGAIHSQNYKGIAEAMRRKGC